jgi:hypothetical protein
LPISTVASPGGLAPEAVKFGNALGHVVEYLAGHGFAVDDPGRRVMPP